MKVQINVKMVSNTPASATLDIVVGATDTVLSVKERVAALQLIPFPNPDLMLNGEVLGDGQQLCDCGVKDLSSLDFVVRATQDTLIKQLSELLQARDLSCDELGLLYCYKHGVSVSQALAAIGHESTFQEFIKKQKSFQLENNVVALVREDTVLKPFSVAAEVEQILRANGPGALDMKELCLKFVQKFNVSLSSIVGMKPAEFLAKEKDLFTVTNRGLVCLKSAHPRPQKPRQGAPAAAEQGLPEAAARSAEGPVEPAVEAPPGLGASDPVDAALLGSAENQQYMDLHNKICGRSFNSKVAQAVNEVVDAVSEAVFLNVDHVVKGGSIGKGTAISGLSDAEVVFFLRGLPLAAHERWLPPLLRAVAGVLTERLGSERGVEGVRTTEDSVQLQARGLAVVDLRFSPVFEAYAQTVQVLGEQGPEARRFYTPSLVEQRVQFIARQPGPVKVTIRLLKWWRDQQEWSSRLVRPTDEILELMAIYSSVQTKPSDQRKAIANVMSLLSRFDELRIIWSNFYTKSDVWAPLLRQRPLLMDPVNPFVNIAEPQCFDARELMAAARTTHFFW
mmetsp:Transcript_43425/g.120703  ORF Transcript_43425/g.120703 Transcript_43425/m.120703 type:complete len:564 (-) Transcript_43425:148-1839(-)